MIELHLVLRAQPNQTRNLIDALQALAKSARSAPGCHAVEIFMTVDRPRYICYDEIWESETELNRMIASHHFSQLAALMELSSEPPNCEFRFINQTFGLSYAEQVRGCEPDLLPKPN